MLRMYVGIRLNEDLQIGRGDGTWPDTVLGLNTCVRRTIRRRGVVHPTSPHRNLGLPRCINVLNQEFAVNYIVDGYAAVHPS